MIEWVKVNVTSDVLIINRETNVLDAEFDLLAPTLHFNRPFKIRSTRALDRLPAFAKTCLGWLTEQFINIKVETLSRHDEEAARNLFEYSRQ